jgi:type IV pilus assembly protein PilP
VLMQGNNTHALIKAGTVLHQVKAGNYMGQNFGVITQITENEIKLRELVEDVYGDWVEKVSDLKLQERGEAGK